MRYSAILPAGLVLAQAVAAASAPWQGHGKDGQHTAIAFPPAQNINRIIWKTPIDLEPQIGEMIHQASPLITSADTVIIAVKTGKSGDYNIEARNHGTGARLWTQRSRYRPPPHDFTPAIGPVLTLQNKVYYPGVGGLIHYRTDPDQATGVYGTIAFYDIAAYKAHPKAYQNTVQISTQLTADAAGNIYFGFVAAADAPGGLKNGIARIAADGTATWIPVAAAAGDFGITEVQTNSAPAVSHNGKLIYIAVSNGPHNFNGYLLALDSTTLAPKYRVRLLEPSNGHDAVLSDNSTASPTVGPDGDVYIGVRSGTAPGYHNGRGWLLHFDATLTQEKTSGSFGWDDTVSVIAAPAVPSYTGKSSYLLMSTYNNYAGIGTGTGHNEIAILDPNATDLDEYSKNKVRVMKEVMTIANPTHLPDGASGQTYEWCINTVAVDPATSSIFAGAEDGFLYRWDLKTNSFSQRLRLSQPGGEANTPTAIGPDGTVYAINHGRFYAVGN